MDPAIIAAISALGSALISGAAVFVTTRSKTKVDFGQSITSGFQQLTEQLQNEIKELRVIINDQKIRQDTQTRWLRHMEGHSRRLEDHCADLERRMLDAGLQVPVFRMDEGPETKFP